MEILRDEYRVLAATNGANALKIARGEPPPDVILLDVMMPEMSGHEVCRRLKQESVTRKIPVIFVTALNQVEEACSAWRRALMSFDAAQDAVRIAAVQDKLMRHAPDGAP